VLTAGGLLVKGQFIISLPVALTRVVHTEPLPEGFLLSVSCSPQIAVTRGTTFVRAFLTDPALGKNISSYMLFADYITNSAPSGFPTGAITASIDGPGNIKTINIFGIAPGADFQANIPANVTWKIRAGQFNFTASAAVANRQCGVQIGSAGATIYTALPQLPVVAGATTTVSYAPSSAASTLNAAVINNILPDPCIIKQPGFIGSFTLNKDAADQYSGGFFLVEEWIQDV
jgi:hypothetical protein